MIELFFEQLASYYKENNLSDIILYICNCSITFRNFFLQFIFPELKELPNIIEIEREYSSSDKSARVDFKFIVNDEIYLIENKIYDSIHHFEKYLKSYPNCNIGYIANYDVSQLNIYENRNNWDEFYKKAVSELVPKIDNQEEKILLNGFLKYLKGVCNIMEKRDFIPNLTCDLYYLNQLFNELITMHGENGLIINNMARGCCDYRSGKYYQYKKGKLFHEYWFGIYTADFSHNIMINAIGRNINDFNIIDGEYYKKPYYEKNSVWFELKSYLFKQLNDSTIHHKKKHEIIVNFFHEVMHITEQTF